MNVEIVRELPGFTGEACLVRRGRRYFVVSSTATPGQPETLVFPADEAGKVTDWGEVAGGRGVGREEAIRELEEGYGL